MSIASENPHSSVVRCLRQFVDLARVGSGEGRPVSRSRRVNVPAYVYHEAFAALKELDTRPTPAQPIPIDTPASEGGDKSTEAQVYRAIIVRIQESAARYLPGELTKDEFINAVLEAVDGPEWRDANASYDGG